MVDRVRSEMQQKFCIPSGASVLVAVSGGIDSVALLHILNQLPYKLAVAHVNFGLRGVESDRDEIFVETLSRTYNLPYFIKKFNLAENKQSKGESVQMLARKLRYGWFEELAVNHSFDAVAVAHNLNDQIETFFINLIRGTGLAGLQGIPSRNGKIVRPLLQFSRNEIVAYANLNNLKFVEDSTNRKADYLRNRIRHRVVPVFNELQPSFSNIMAGNFEKLALAAKLVNEALSEIKTQATVKVGNDTRIRIDQIQHSRHAELALHYLLDEYGFNQDAVSKIRNVLAGSSGKIFQSRTHILVKDRECLIVTPLNTGESVPDSITIPSVEAELFSPLHLSFHTFHTKKGFAPPSDPNLAFLDLESVVFPLTLRSWRHGDRFHPLGLECQVKLSDFFISKRLSLLQKKNVRLLCDATGSILWVVGFRISNTHRITPSTENILQIVMHD